MPVLAGQVVESAEASDQFLWDFRKTIADLIADEHYGQVQASLKERGIGHYSANRTRAARLCCRRHGSEEAERRSDERDVDASPGSQQRAISATTPMIASRHRWRISTDRISLRPSR